MFEIPAPPELLREPGSPLRGVWHHDRSDRHDVQRFFEWGVDPKGGVSVDTPNSTPGDHVALRADIDMICALTSCSAEQPTNARFEPIDDEIITRPC